MVSQCGTRGGRTRRKRHARRKQRTHRKQRSHRNKLRRQSGGADIIYFYEAYDDEGFLTNFYVNGIETARQPRENVPFDNTGMIPFMYRPTAYIDEEIPFANSEQAFCFEKALFFDPTLSPACVKLLDKILEISDPNVIKEIGSTRTGITLDDNNKIVTTETGDWKIIQTQGGARWGLWTAAGQEVMERILRAKFSSPDMAQKLLGTGKAYLAEDSPTDAYWGIGYSRAEAQRLHDTDPHIDDKGNPFWIKNGQPSQNKLGGLLMKIREELQS